MGHTENAFRDCQRYVVELCTRVEGLLSYPFTYCAVALRQSTRLQFTLQSSALKIPALGDSVRTSSITFTLAYRLHPIEDDPAH